MNDTHGLTKEQVKEFGQSLGLELSEEASEGVRSLVESVRSAVLVKASGFTPDAPPATFFDARWS